MFLSRFCGPDDIITPGIEAREPKYAFRAARNTTIPAACAVFLYLPLPPIIPTSKHYRWRRSFHDHMPAFRIRRALPRSIWKNYLKFTKVRNPFDRAFSLYFWANNGEPPSRHTAEAINTYISSIKPFHLSNWYLYTINNKLLIDVIIRYENLVVDMQTVLEQIGIKEPVELESAKGGFRPPGIHYRDVLSSSVRQLNERHAQPELSQFGYRW